MESRARHRLRNLRDQTIGDFTIECRGRKWRVDNTILNAETDWLEAILHSRSSQVPGVADLSLWDPDALDQLLVFLYTGDYDKLALVESPPTSVVQQALVPINSTKADDWDCVSDGPATTIPDCASMETITRVLTSLILVYTYTGALALEDLTNIVADKFFALAHYLWKSQLSDVLATLFDNVDSDDRELRLKVLERCLANYALVRADADAIRVLEEHEFAAWNLGHKLHRTSGLLKALDAECRAQKQEITKLRAKTPSLESRSPPTEGSAATTSQLEKRMADLERQLSKARTKSKGHLTQIQSLEARAANTQDPKNTNRKLNERVANLERQLSDQSKKASARENEVRSSQNALQKRCKEIERLKIDVKDLIHE
ncbi:uncharacterized protein HMPREF1541_01117 [Cyphellophora europaea CBS 101466]|uniref:BTB domain-containing protein n=1 Tax=Cyphellophora europaea (strain CBS 101466) TaxID=1220924 RepID=W2SG06_CYPE1|nr:uncharacterized protein HMPREF1541_01117 [Cyphellophora europaea CBS 101466]ETN46928.1 hypothetical protein HMPREF1541_01117 [Cyphellophora europaea CBS 101466]